MDVCCWDNSKRDFLKGEEIVSEKKCIEKAGFRRRSRKIKTRCVDCGTVVYKASKDKQLCLSCYKKRLGVSIDLGPNLSILPTYD